MPATKNAILLLAHGSPDRPEDVPEFLKQITQGRPLPENVIAEVKHRYGLIGSSPLTCWTLQQRDQLAHELGIPVHAGMRNWKPYIAEAVQAMTAEGITHAIAICLAPQNSRTSVGLYRAALAKENPPFDVDFVESWHDHPKLIEALKEKLLAGWKPACQEAGTQIRIIFTAHSVPQRTISEGDPYEAQSKETAALVATQAGLAKDDWTFAFQSQGMSGGAWLGPTVEDTIRDLKAGGHRGVFIQPIGFLCDHVEVLYDIDIGFKQFAGQEGLRLWRAESLNGSMLLTQALADLARTRLT
ncbi:MAG TPA: ferrochelatase [Terriglobales bacterium]|nr:ferrochelatase [Terriglobales bacterium]